MIQRPYPVHSIDGLGGWLKNERMTMNATELGAQLARDLMELGGERRPCHRIEFKGGNWPDGEIPQGGMNEDALARFFALRLAVLMPPNVLVSRQGGAK